MPEFGDSATLEYCLLELVLNALKAEATAIAVRIHLSDRRIQVVDNGCGISRNALKYVGECTAETEAGLGALEMVNVVTDGHLAKIRELSSRLIVMSRRRFTTSTYGKIFSNGKVHEVERIENRPSYGTTVIVQALKESCNWGREIDTFMVKSIIVYLSLVNNQVSFSVRDDMKGSIVLRIGKYQKQKRLLRVIFEKPLDSGQVQRIEMQKLGKLQVSGFWGAKCTEVRKIQQVLLNLRPVDCPVLEKFMIRIITKIYCSYEENANTCQEAIFFLLYFECPDTEYKISVKDTKTTIDFHQIDRILASVERCLRKTEIKSAIPPTTCRPLEQNLGVKQRTSFCTKVSRRSFLSTATTAGMKRQLRPLPVVKNVPRFGIEDSNVTNRDVVPTVQLSTEDSVPTKWQKIPTVSPHWPENFAEASKVTCKSQESVKQSENPITEPLQESENAAANESSPALKKYQYDNHGVLWISQKCNEKLSNHMAETYDIDCSQWSDWIYEPVTRNSVSEKPGELTGPVLYKRFKFLPLHLHALLPFLNKKLSKDLSEDVGMPKNLNFNNHCQDLNVRQCTRRPLEFRLEDESLKTMKVLNQVNREFIVALTKQNGKKLVVVVDQHAMHERLRYDDLLAAYKWDQENQQFISFALHRPLIISDLSASACRLLSSNQSLLARYGMNLASRNGTTLLIFAVPRCFVKKTFRGDNADVEIAVRKLLQEVLDNLTSNAPRNILPFTIHDAVASEACHGAIRFGDPLTPKECESLVACWQETDAPNSCAHGRPCVVPLLELTPRRNHHHELVRQGKLNFASLRGFRRTTGKTLVTTMRYHPYVTLAKRHESRFHDDEALR